MKKSFKIKKSVVESMVDDAIRSLLNEEIDLGPYDSQSEKSSRVRQDTPEQTEIRKQIRRLRNMIDDCETDEEAESIRQKIAALKKKAGFDKVYESFDYDDLSQDVMHWALNYADNGHDFPINAVQYMQEWYNGDDSALDTVCERFAEWKGIECDDNVRSAVEKAANTIGYYENWNNDKIEFDEAKEAQAVEDMKKKIRSMSQKISSTDEELPELKRQVDALKNKLSTMDESKLNTAIQKSIKKVLKEGIYDYPDGIDHIIFLSENDRELYEEYRQIAKACMKLYKKDVQLTLERLMESSIMKRYQQHCFRKYAKEQQGLDRMNSPREFRRFIAEKIIDEVVNGAWDDKDMMNESLNEEYVWWGDTKPLETIYSAAQEIVRNYGDADPEGNYESTAIFDLVKWANEVMDEADKYIHYEAHNTAIGESRLNEENDESSKQYGYQNVSDDFVEKVGENGYEVWVPDYCLPYLVNGDMDVYDEDEIAEMQAFEKQFDGKLLNGMNAGDFCIPMDGEEPALVGKNDVFPKDMGAECYKFFLPAK